MKKLILVFTLLTLLLSIVAVQAQNAAPELVTWWATERGRDTAATRDLHFQLHLAKQ